MEFLKSLVPAVISGDGYNEHKEVVPRDSGPRLLRLKRLGLLAMGQTIDEDPIERKMGVDPGMRSSRLACSSRTRFKGTPDYTYTS